MMITTTSTDAYAKREAGGKGYNLYLLTRANLPVPPWVVLGANLFRRFREQTGIGEQLDQLVEKSCDLSTAAAHLIDLVESTPIPSDIADEIDTARARLGKDTIAVRSSAKGEDSARLSFAGQMTSFLHVTSSDEVRSRVRACWASAYSERNLVYRAQNGINPITGVEVAVILQEMISADVSGVMFTCDPVTSDSSRLVINTVYGLGEGLVSGALEADHFVLEKGTGQVLRSDIASKTTRLINGGAGGVVESTVPEDLVNQPSVSQKVLQDLRALGRRVEAFFRYPQDIEFSLEDGQLYLLQARPVTTPVLTADPPFQIWDNSNIVESYGGITLPLTFSFARFVYHQVYVQFCEILLVPPCQIRRMDRILRNMLGSFNGRIYYNLLN